ncbi:MAG: YdcF family protein [Pseudomonadota bacterium]
MAANSQEDTRPVGTERRLRRTWRAVWLVCVIAAVFVIAGFFYFASMVQEAASGKHSPASADGIIVLTGGSERISDALSLLRDERGSRLLISGVNPRTTAGQLARRTGTARALFNCCIDLGYAAQNTLGNAVEGARWATENEFDSLILVTSAYHMPRAMLEFGRLMPQAELHPWPVALSAYSSENWWTKPVTLRVMIEEYSKYLMASARMRVGQATLSLPDSRPETMRSQAQ